MNNMDERFDTIVGQMRVFILTNFLYYLYLFLTEGLVIFVNGFGNIKIIVWSLLFLPILNIVEELCEISLDSNGLWDYIIPIFKLGIYILLYIGLKIIVNNYLNINITLV